MPARFFLIALALLLGAFALGVGFGADSLPFNPQAPFSDATISRYPDALHFQRTLREAHTLPLWNPHLMGGQPFAANPGAKVWYPLTWLVLLWNPALHISVMTFFHLWLGGVGMWVWARRSGLESWGAALAAVGYALAPKLVAHAGSGHLDILIAAAWLPWLLAALHGLHERGLSGKYIVGAAACAAFIFIGAVQLTPYFWGLALVYAVYLRLNALYVFPIGFFTVAFTAVQWMPLLALRDFLSRGDIRPEDAALFSLKPGQFVGLLIGNHGGDAEGMTYVGVSLLVFALVGLLLAPRRHRLLWGVVVFAGLYGMGQHFPLWSVLVKVCPPLLWFRVPSRVWLVAALLLPYLAGWGLQILLEKPPQSARARLGVVGVIGLGLSCGVGSLVTLRESEIAPAALWGIFFLPLAGLLVALAIFRRTDTRYLAPLVLLLVVVDCLWIDRSLIEGRPQAAWLRREPPALIAHLAQTGGRIYTPDYSIPQQDTAYWRIARFDGVDPFQLRGFIDISAAATGVPREGYSTTVPSVVVLPQDPATHHYQDAPMDARLLAEWGVQWVITGYPITITGLDLVEQDAALYFYRNQYAEGEALVWENPNRLLTRYRPEAPTIAPAPGWIGGGGVYTYRPDAVFTGMGMTIATILGAVASLVAERRQRART